MAGKATVLKEQSLEDATVALINSDPELRELLRELIKDGILRYRHVVRWGSPDARLSAIKAMVPGFIRSMGRVEQSEQEAKMREAYDRLLGDGAVILDEAPDEPEVLPDDTPG